MASSPKIMINNEPSKLSRSDDVINQLRQDLQINKEDVFTDNKFDLDLFNKRYEDVRKRRQDIFTDLQEDRISELNISKSIKKLHQFTVGELLFKMKDAMFGLLQDLLRLQFTKDTFLKQNRLFYIGLFILVILLIVFLFRKQDLQEKKCFSLFGSKYGSLFNSDKSNFDKDIIKYFKTIIH